MFKLEEKKACVTFFLADANKGGIFEYTFNKMNGKKYRSTVTININEIVRISWMKTNSTIIAFQSVGGDGLLAEHSVHVRGNRDIVRWHIYQVAKRLGIALPYNLAN